MQTSVDYFLPRKYDVISQLHHIYAKDPLCVTRLKCGMYSMENDCSAYQQQLPPSVLPILKIYLAIFFEKNFKFPLTGNSPATVMLFEDFGQVLWMA